MVFVLVNPAVALLGFHHQFIVTKASVNERIDKRACKVSTSRVDIGRQP
jgi:hypothetical protein